MHPTAHLRSVASVEADGKRVADAFIALIEEYTPDEQVYFLLACRRRLKRSTPLVEAFAQRFEPEELLQA